MRYNSVEHMLKNRRYIGEYSYRDTVIPDGIPAIVPRDLFDRVQAKMAKNKKTDPQGVGFGDYCSFISLTRALAPMRWAPALIIA